MIKIYKSYIPQVSVVMAAYNRSSLIKRSIDSVIRQSFNKWELIIVDDGSTDASYEIINSYVSRYENIRYLKHANRKLALTRNAGILASAANYITFLDSDDEYLPEHLELRYNYMIENQNVDFIHGGVEIIGNPYVKDKYNLAKQIHLMDCTIGGTFFGKKNVFEKLDGFTDIPYSEDSEFFERAEKLFNIKKVNYPTYIYYRDSEDGICNNI